MADTRSFIITLRSHPSESYLTDTFLTYLKPFLDTQLRYTYAFEELGTLEEHVHIYVETNFRDKEKLCKNKIFKEVSNKYKNVCHDKQTLFSPTWVDKANQAKLIKEGEELKTLGYVHKENGDKKFQGNFSNQEILTAVDIYYKEKLLDKSKIGKNQYKYVTTKQAHATVENYCERNNVSINHPKLVQLMKADRYSFIQISKQQQACLWEELTLVHSDKFTKDEVEQAELRAENGKYSECFAPLDKQYKIEMLQRKFIQQQNLSKEFTEFCREWDMLESQQEE